MFDPYMQGPSQSGTAMEERPIIFEEYDSHSTSVDVQNSPNHGFGPMPEKRRKRAAIVSVGLSFVIMVVLLGAFTKPREELHEVNKNTSTLNEGEMVCRKSDQYHHVGVFIWSLNLLGIIFGEFVNRLCVMFEEYFHLLTRYNNSKVKMLYACFNDISFRDVFFATLVAFIIIGSTLLSQGTQYFKYEHVEIILSGVGSSTVVLYLLSMDTLSRVQISSLMENNNRLVANGLAWSYYFGYLKLILPEFHERINTSKWKGLLSSPTLFILMPRDCYAYGDISDESKDKNIKLVQDGVIQCEVKRAGIAKRAFRNNIYQIVTKQDDSEVLLHVLAEYASPLCSIYDMSHSSEAKLSPEDRDEQAKLFVRTLKAILSDPCVPEIRGKCKLVPYARGTDDISKILAEAVLQEMAGISELDDLDGAVRETRETSRLIDL